MSDVLPVQRPGFVHRRYGYRGVVLCCEPWCTAAKAWKRMMGSLVRFRRPKKATSSRIPVAVFLVFLSTPWVEGGPQELQKGCHRPLPVAARRCLWLASGVAKLPRGELQPFYHCFLAF